MLARLSIRDIVLIERLDIEFARGLAVLTGETGAGKSILLDAFALALGGRNRPGQNASPERRRRRNVRDLSNLSTGCPSGADRPH